MRDFKVGRDEMVVLDESGMDAMLAGGRGILRMKWFVLGACGGNVVFLGLFESNYGTIDNKTELNLVDDASYMNWGEGLRMPTRGELNEFLDPKNYTRTWTTQRGQ